MAWRYGGALERQFVLLVMLAPIVAVLTFVGANTYLFFAQTADRARVPSQPRHPNGRILLAVFPAGDHWVDVQQRLLW